MWKLFIILLFNYLFIIDYVMGDVILEFDVNINYFFLLINDFKD